MVGVLPGIGPAGGTAILIPMTFSLDPTAAIIMLAAIYYGSMRRYDNFSANQYTR